MARYCEPGDEEDVDAWYDDAESWVGGGGGGGWVANDGGGEDVNHRDDARVGVVVSIDIADVAGSSSLRLPLWEGADPMVKFVGC